MVNKSNNKLDVVIEVKGGKTQTQSNKNTVQNFRPSQPSVLTEDYKSCNICLRRYNDNAYQKHLPTCERKAKEAIIKGKSKQSTASGPFKPSVNNTGNNFSNKKTNY